MTKERVPLAAAQVIAWKVAADLRPFCDRIEIAGSIRRRKDTVKDVEILCVPKDGRTDLFGERIIDAVTQYLELEIISGRHWATRPDTKGRKTFGASNKLLLYDGFPVDVFSTSEINWGMALFIRTGPAEWNIRAMARFKQLGMAGHAYGGITDRDGNEVACPTEADVFKWLGWEMLPPERRS